MVARTPVKASVFLLSYNKKGFALDALRSVLSQSHQDYELWVLENSTDNETRTVIKDSGLLNDPRIKYIELDIDQAVRDSAYVPAWLLNRYYPKANGEYIFYLSDDDVLEWNCLSKCVAHLDEHPEQYVCYFTLLIAGITEPGSSLIPFGCARADLIRTSGQLDGKVDGGQVVHRKACLDKLDQPFFTEDLPDASHCDGTFLESLAEHYEFFPIPLFLATHRATPISVHGTYHAAARHFGMQGFVPSSAHAISLARMVLLKGNPLTGGVNDQDSGAGPRA